MEPFMPDTTEELALDVSLEKARALHRVWRALNDGDCPACHQYCGSDKVIRVYDESLHMRILGMKSVLQIQCPACGFFVTTEEIKLIEELFAPAMDAAMRIFLGWRAEVQIEQVGKK